MVKEVDMSNTTSPRRAVILTALELEYMEVRAHLQNLREEEYDSAVYEIGTFTTPLYTWQVCITEIGSGNDVAALAAQRAMSYFKSDVAFFVGVAGGLKEKELKLGDVVCATKVYGYEFGKDTEDGFKIRSEIGNPSARIVSRAVAEKRKDDWQKRIQPPLSQSNPKAYTAAIAAGNKVVGAAKVYDFLRNNFSDAIAVEMEGYGFLLAMHWKPEIETIVIRGISDLIADKTPEQDKEWQPIAARNASAFAFELLAKLPFKGQGTPQPVGLIPMPIANLGGNKGDVKKSIEEASHLNIPHPLPDSYREKVQIFYSYVGDDEAFAKQLDVHLAVLKRHKGVVTSYAGNAGVDRMEQLNRADIILLFISPYFINAFDIYEKEAKRAMERMQEGVRVIPVLLRPTNGWQLEEFGNLQVVPRDKPVSAYSDKDSVFSAIAGEIGTIVMNIRKERGLPA